MVAQETNQGLPETLVSLTADLAAAPAVRAARSGKDIRAWRPRDPSITEHTLVVLEVFRTIRPLDLPRCLADPDPPRKPGGILKILSRKKS
jgi:hypothetical protein